MMNELDPKIIHINASPEFLSKPENIQMINNMVNKAAQSQLIFTIHTVEKTAEGTDYIQNPDNRKRLENGSARIISYWQSSGNIPLTNKMAREYKFSSYASARIAEIRKAGIIVLSKTVTEDGNKVKAFYLGCMCEEPGRDVMGCYLHDTKLRLA